METEENGGYGRWKDSLLWYDLQTEVMISFPGMDSIPFYPPIARLLIEKQTQNLILILLRFMNLRKLESV